MVKFPQLLGNTLYISTQLMNTSLSQPNVTVVKDKIISSTCHCLSEEPLHDGLKHLFQVYILIGFWKVFLLRTDFNLFD